MKHNNRKLKIVLATVALALIASVIVVFVRFRSAVEQGKIPIPPMAAKTVMSLANVHQTATKDGAVQWELKADSAELEAETGFMVLTNPEVRFFIEDGTKVRLTAKRGVLDTKKNDIEVTGNVRVKNSRYTLLTEMLAYKHDTRILQADKPVRIISRAIELKAATMTYDLNANRASFKGAVEGNLNEMSPL